MKQANNMKRSFFNRLGLLAATALLGVWAPEAQAQGSSTPCGSPPGTAKVGLVRDGNDLVVRIKPSENVPSTEYIAAMTLTVKFTDDANVSLGTPTWASTAVGQAWDGFGPFTTFAGSVNTVSNGGFKYTTFATENELFTTLATAGVTLTANTELDLLRIPLTISNNACAVFSLENDAYTGTNNLDWYISFSGCDAQNGFYGTAVAPVVNENTGLGYCTIQSAIDAAQTVNGHTLRVAAGTYNERVTISKELSLLGPNATVAGSGSRAAEAIVQFPAGSPNGSALIRVLSNLHNVTIAGFDLRCQDATIPNYHYLISATPSSSSDATEKWNNMTIRNNRMYSSEIPLYILTDFDAHGSGALIEGNYINGGPNVNSIYNRGMYVGGTSGTIQDNVVENCNIAIQYMPYGNPNTGLIRRNTVTASVIGLYHNYQTIGAAQVTWEQNVASAAPNPQTGLATQVDGARTTAAIFNGIYFNTFGTQGSGAPPVALFQNNTINAANPGGTTSTVFRAVYLENSAAGATANLTNNSFTGYTVGVERAANATGATVNATCNWWGGDALATVSAAAGTATSFIPFLTNGTDNDPAIGFQPVPNSCTGGPVRVYSDAAETNLVSAHATIQAAINAGTTLAGYVVRVDAGVYNENVYVSKALKMRGPNAGISPNDPNDPLQPNPARVAEAEIRYVAPAGGEWFLTNVVTLFANAPGFELDGFTLNGLVKTVTGRRGFRNWGTEENARIVNNNVINVDEGISYSSPQGVWINDNRLTEIGGSLAAIVVDHGNAGTSRDNNQIKRNVVISPVVRGILLNNFNVYAQIENNVIRDAQLGIQLGQVDRAATTPGFIPTIANNDIQSWFYGIWVNQQFGNTSQGTLPTTWQVTGNTIAKKTGVSAQEMWGIFLSGINIGASVNVANNTITGADYGIRLWNVASAAGVNISGGTISNSSLAAISVMTDIANSGAGYTGGRATYNDQSKFPAVYTVNISGVDMVDNTRGIVGVRHTGGTTANTSSAMIALNVQNVSITGGTDGVRLSISNGTPDMIQATISESVISGQSGMRINSLVNSGVSAPCNWWGSSTPSVILSTLTASVSSNVLVPSYLNDGTDTAPGTTGFQPASGTCVPAPVRVYSDLAETTLVSSHFDIQQAISAATTQNGYVVRVDAGTYAEQVSVNKAITLRGANTATALTVCGQTRAAETVINGSTGAAITIASNGVTVDGFELQGAIGLTSTGRTDLVVINNKVNTVAQGIAVSGATTSATDEVTITGNAVTLSTQAVSTTATVGIALASVGGTAAATVSNNLICGGFYGYALSNVTTTPRTVISGGSITGVMQGVAAFNSMLVAPFTNLPMTVGVDGITMSGFTGNVTAIPSANFHAGVYAFTAGSNSAAVLDITVNNVDISGTGKHNQANGGLYFADFSTVTSTLLNVSVTNSHIHDNLNRGVIVRGANAVATVSNSDILNNGADPIGTGGNNGYGLIANNGSQLTVSNCNIVNPATQVGFTVYAIGTGPAPASTFTISNSSILRNGNGAHMAIGGGGTLNATCNWWGVTSAQDVAAVAAAAASYTNWLVSGTDTDLATRGFQPAAGTCIGQPFTLSATSLNVNCNGAADGSIDLTVTGGLAPFTYAWTNSATTQDLSGLAPDTYNVTVTDSLGTTGTLATAITISEPAAVVLSASATPILCFGGTSELTASATGADSLRVNGVLYTAALSGLTPGEYTVIAYGTNGNNNGVCTDTEVVTITQPAAALSVSTSVTDATCNTTSDGQAVATATGGTAPYGYSWNDGAAQTTATATGLGTGSYSVTVTDANGCTANASATIGQAAHSGSTWYVATTGSNSNNGNAGCPVQTIQFAINSATAGDVVDVAAGTYAENVNVNKRVTVDGAGSSSGTQVNGGLTISASGSSFSNRLVVKDLSVTNASGDGVTINNGVSRITLDNVSSSSNSADGVEILGGALVNRDLLLQNMRINDNLANNGIRMGGLANVDSLRVIGGEVKRNRSIGFAFSPSASATGLTNLIMDGTVFEKNGAGMFTSGSNTGSGDISFFAFNGNATLNNVTVIGADNAGDAAGAVAVQFRGKDVPAAAGTITVNGLSITGHYKRIVSNVASPLAYGLFIMNYTNVSPISLNNVVVNIGTGHALGVAGLSNTLELGNTSLNAQAAGYAHIINGTSTQNNVLSNVNATNATFGGVAAASATLAQQFAIEDKVLHAIDAATLGFVRVKTGEVFVTANSFIAPTTTAPSIQRGVDAATAADILHVGAGTYTETVTVNKALDIRGANYGVNPNTGSRVDESILSGTFLTQSNTISIDGFAMTGAGMAVQAPGTGQSGITVRNNHMYAKNGGRMIEYWGTATATTNWTVSNNRIENIQAVDATAITLFNITGVTISNNVIQHTNSSFSGRRGLNLDGCRDVVFSGNTVNMGLVNPASDNSDGSFTAARYSLQLSASNRSVTNATINGNTMVGGYSGVHTLGNGVFDGIAITNNEMNNNVLGIRFQAGTNGPAGEQKNITVENNTISGSNRSIYLEDVDPYQNVTIGNNSLVRTTAGAALELKAGVILVGGAVNATCNWFGSEVPANVQARVIGNVSFVPWLLDGSDVSASIGFQPGGACAGYPVTLTARAVLSGAYVTASGLMRDDLRSLSAFPTTEPYTALGFTDVTVTGPLANGVLDVNGGDAIVDWVLVEVRDAATPATVLHRRAALIQRDGDIVDVDGSTPIYVWTLARANYHVAVRHRNHLGAMTASSQFLGNAPSLIDFRSIATFGTEAQRQLVPGVSGLWEGNTRGNNRIAYTGANNDRDPILLALPTPSPTSVRLDVYNQSDVNLDGDVKYTGLNNDRAPILTNIGGTVPTAVRNQQLP